MADILELTHISKSFFTDKGTIEVLKDISFSLPAGKIIALVGPSGCGKSTVLNLISGLEQPTEGKIVKLGKLGYMFQKDNLLDWRNVYKNITLGLEISRQKNREDYCHIDALIEKYGLKEFRDYHPKELSGGMRQRVALIRTLTLNPDILLLDEPFSALDYQTKLTVQEDVYHIIRQENKATILVTHDITEAIAMADYVVVLTKRPARIKSIHKIDFFPNEERTPLRVRTSSDFKTYFDAIWKELNDND